MKPRLGEQIEALGEAFSAALCRGLIEADRLRFIVAPGRVEFSAALCRGLIEAMRDFESQLGAWQSFPRLYAAASLKHQERAEELARIDAFSAALCRGLIEATASSVPCASSGAVFRGFMPRPH